MCLNEAIDIVIFDGVCITWDSDGMRLHKLGYGWDVFEKSASGIIRAHIEFKNYIEEQRNESPSK